MSVQRVDVQKLLRALGIRATKQGGKWAAPCPNPAHPHPEGKKSTPSWSIKDDGSELTGSHFCFGACGLRGGPWELVAACKGLSLEAAGEWLSAEVGGTRPVSELDIPEVRVVLSRQAPVEMQLPWGVRIPSLDGSEWFPPAYRYLTDPVPAEKHLRGAGPRGVAPWQLERWHIGFATKGHCAFRVVIPIHTRGRLVSYVARSFINDSRNRYDVAEKTYPGAWPEAAIFGEIGWEQDSEVALITEGIFGALAFERVGAQNPSAILGAANLGHAKLDLLARFPLLLVATDPDEAGRKAYELIRTALCRYSEVRRVPLVNKPDEAPDDELRWGYEEALRGRGWETGAPI